jgi:hypothetical protein
LARQPHQEIVTETEQRIRRALDGNRRTDDWAWSGIARRTNA